MSDRPVDPQWARLLSLSAHDLRSPLSVVNGYIRMVLSDRTGPVTDQQRRFLTEAGKSCARLSSLIDEMSQLSDLEDGTAIFNLSPADLHSLLAHAVTALPELPDREVRVSLATADAPSRVHADAARLKGAFVSLISGLRRELVTSDELFIRERIRRDSGGAVSWIAIGDRTRIDALTEADAAALTRFDEWREGCGLSLAIARRVVERHGGRLWSPAVDSKAGAVVVMPLAE